MLKRAEVTFPKLRNKFKTHLESNHETDQVEEFGPLVHQGTEGSSIFIKILSCFRTFFLL